MGHDPPKAIIFTNIITKPCFETAQNILKTDSQRYRPTDRRTDKVGSNLKIIMHAHHEDKCLEIFEPILLFFQSSDYFINNFYEFELKFLQVCFSFKVLPFCS